MALKIVCSGLLVRHPLGGHTWHHLQYLLGFQQLGHEVAFVEDHGWPDSCYDAARDVMSDDPSFGIRYVQKVFRRSGYQGPWCYLAANGASYGMSRDELRALCRKCDVYFNLSNINWLPELELCRRRTLVDTDPVFTQIGGHGAGGQFSQYDVLFTYGENVHQSGCEMPTAGQRWAPTRQPIVLDQWPVEPGDPSAPFTTLINWTAYGDRQCNGRVYGQKDREFRQFIDLPKHAAADMEIAINAPSEVKEAFAARGWRVTDPLDISHDPWTYQAHLRRSKAEFCVAKHAYVATRCGWFSDRSAGYLASGRPVVLQDTAFSRALPCGSGLLAYTTQEEAIAAVLAVNADYENHCRAARVIAQESFDARVVLQAMLDRVL